MVTAERWMELLKGDGLTHVARLDLMRDGVPDFHGWWFSFSNPPRYHQACVTLSDWNLRGLDGPGAERERVLWELRRLLKGELE